MEISNDWIGRKRHCKSLFPSQDLAKVKRAANVLNDLLGPPCVLQMQGQRAGRHENWEMLHAGSLH